MRSATARQPKRKNATKDPSAKALPAFAEAFPPEPLPAQPLSPPPAVWEAASYLGPARVVSIENGTIRLESPDAFPSAVSALAYPYEFAVGDKVLVISRGNDWYIIGVLQGSGQTTFTADGDILFRAPCGKIEFEAGESLEMKSGKIRMVALDLEMSIRHMFQRVECLTQWVTDALHLRAGRSNVHVSGDYLVKADRITQRADGDVTLNGKSINLN